MKQFLVPSSLNINQLVEQNPIKFDGFHPDKVAYVCDAIYRGLLKINGESNKHRFKAESGYVPLHSDILRFYLGAKYCVNIIQWMIATGIIERDQQYRPGVVSFGYRFSKRYRFDKQKWQEVKDFVLSRKKAIAFQHEVAMSRTVSQLSEWYDGLTMDHEMASFANEFMFGDRLQIGINGLESVSGKDLKRARRYLNNSTLLELYKNDLSNLHSQDSTGLRLHTPITRLPKVFRSFLTYKGEKLAQTDLRNSQLFFTLFLFQKANWKKTKTNSHIWEGVGVKLVPFVSQSLDSIMSLKSPKSQYCGAFRDDLFFELVTKGKFYDYFVEKMDDLGSFFEFDELEDKRKIVKGLILAQIYGDEFVQGQRPFVFTDVAPSKEREYRLFSPRKRHNNNWLYSGRNELLFDAFKQDMPTVAGIYRYLKSYDNADLAKVLQRIESTAILELTCKRIGREMGKIPLFPLHDCLVTTAKNIEDVDVILKETVNGFIGASPSTEIMLWDEYAELLPFEIDL